MRISSKAEKTSRGYHGVDIAVRLDGRRQLSVVHKGRAKGDAGSFHKPVALRGNLSDDFTADFA